MASSGGVRLTLVSSPLPTSPEGRNLGRRAGKVLPLPLVSPETERGVPGELVPWEVGEEGFVE